MAHLKQIKSLRLQGRTRNLALAACMAVIAFNLIASYLNYTPGGGTTKTFTPDARRISARSSFQGAQSMELEYVPRTIVHYSSS